MMKTLNKLIAAFALTIAFSLVAAPAHADGMKDWKRAVAKKVAKKQKYPRSALAREIEGRAKVRLNVSADGTISSHEIVLETGESVLDREIPKLVKRLNPLPALPDGKTELSFVLPLNWRLN
jgi:periplasmic protein TonB